MKDELVSFKVAKLAKEKGFNYAYEFYDKDGKLEEFGMVSGWCNSTDENYPAPTQSLLQKWLRDKFKIYITIGVNYNTKGNIESFNYSIEGSILNKGVFESYEESLENAFYEALNKV